MAGNEIELTVSVPAYNDAATVVPFLRDVAKLLSDNNVQFSILAINDGSKDETGSVLSALTSQIPQLTFRDHPKNLGFGPTLWECYCIPQSEWVMFLPGDAQIPASEIEVLWKARNDADLVLARRHDRQDVWRRRATSWVYNTMISLIAGRRIFDVNSTALLKRSLVRDDHLTQESAFFHAHLVLDALRQGAKIKQVTISHHPRIAGEASGNKWPVIRATFRDMLKYLAGGYR